MERRRRPWALALPAVPALFFFAGCGASYRPLAVADACRCSPSEYCHVRAPPPGSLSAAGECLPLPPSCAKEPTCACLGRPIDACREELGAFTILEPRAVDRCDECSRQEYCWTSPGSRLCRVLPARCEEAPTCGCLRETHRSPASLRCDERAGRIEAGVAGAQ